MKAYPIERDAVRVWGPDAVSFLQGQLSQDLDGIGPGGSAWSLVLQPQGKVGALVRLTRLGADELLLDTDGGWGERLVERLARFKLRVKAEIELLRGPAVAVRGDQGEPVPEASSSGGHALPFSWGGWHGYDLLGDEAEAPDGIAVGTAAEFERLRIEAGFPKMGAELDERTIPAEAGVVERSVSFTKGCYTGQELVARIDSRGGNVPRHLRRLRVAGAVPPPGAEIVAGGKVVGTVTSVAASGTGAVALGYVGRGLGAPAEAEVTWEGQAAVALVEALPPA